MNFAKSVQDGINEQINIELSSAYTYLAMAAFCERLSFRGCGHWMRLQSEEENKHAMRLFNYMSENACRIHLLAVAEPPTDYKNIVEVFEAALQNEQAVSESINKLYEVAYKERAFATAVELQWFLTEQVEEEKTARDLVNKFHLVKDDPAALLDIDRQLAARSGGD